MTHKLPHRAIRISSEILAKIDIIAKKYNRTTPQQVEFFLLKALQSNEKNSTKEK